MISARAGIGRLAIAINFYLITNFFFIFSLYTFKVGKCCKQKKSCI